MARQRLSRARLIEEAAQLVDEVGPDALSLAALAKRFGVAVPSLYKHVENLETLRAEVALLSVRELTEVLRRAAVGRSGAEAVGALAHAYRAYVQGHPGRYATTVRVAGAEEPLSEARRQTAGEAAEVVFRVLEGFGIEGDARVDAARFLRSALHGFSILEAAGGFGIPREVDRSFAAMVEAFVVSLEAWPKEG